jgi:hypothetical protein
MELRHTLPWRLGSRALSLARRAVAYAQRRRKEAGPLYRGKKILWRYTAHYRRARKVYQQETGQAHEPAVSIYDLGVRVVSAGTPNPLLTLPADFDRLVERVAQGAAAALEQATNCTYFPAVPPESIAGRTSEIPAVANGSVISIKLRDPFAVEGLRELSDPLIEQLETKVFGSYVMVDKVYIYRSPICTQAPRASWIWHFDNHPQEMLKVMIYLTDVREDTAAFEYVCDRTTGRPRYGAPLAPLHGNSRVPNQEVERLLASGWRHEIVTGPKGTVLVFDDNVLHRGTLAKSSHRDVVVFQVRPATFKAVPHLDRRWTGSFGDLDFNRDPRVVAPTQRAPQVRAS